jgi:amino acid adenylation domain-containing protein
MLTTTMWQRNLADEFARAWASLAGGRSATEARNTMARNGWNGLCVPAAQGGFGMGWYEAAVLAEGLGRALLPSDIVDPVVAASQLARAAPESLEPVIRGELTVGVCLVPDHLEHTTAYFTGAVPDIVLLFDGGARFRTVSTRELPSEERVTPGGAMFRLRLHRDWPEPVEPDHTALGSGQPDAAAVLLRGAHLLGLGLAAVHSTVERAGTRRQFGKAIGSYQAIAFPLAGQRARLEGLSLALQAQLLHLDDTAGGTDPLARLRPRADSLLEAVLATVKECVDHSLHAFGAAGLADDTVPAACYRRLLMEEVRCAPAPSALTGDLEALPALTREEPAALWANGPPTARLASLQRDRTPLPVNDTATTHADDLCLHQLFERTAENHPDRPALVFPSSTLSYRALDERANQLAHLLHKQGVTPDDPVGICMDRGADAIITVLAVLKAGGACLFLDPAHPAERSAFTLEDSGAVAVIPQQHLLDLLPKIPVPVITLDQARLLLDQHPTDPPQPQAKPQDLAYLVYTSGSTGTPKGVEVEHRNLVNRLQWDARMFPLGPQDVVLHHTALGFDPSIWEIFAPLMSGAALVPVQGGAGDPRRLLQTMRTTGVTAITCVPSVLDLLLEEASPSVAEVTGLRHVFCGGEALPPDLVRRFHQWGTGAVLHNCYGPSECAIDVTHWRCGPQDELGDVPIGLPIDNVRVYVLDEVGAPVPVGHPGELYVGGAGVARGYRNRPALTRERFLPDPFTDEPGSRLYRTGDLVRMREDGAVVFLGRYDDQVKIRGYRIELGEIRTALERRPEVRTAVVTAARGRIDAYVVPDGQNAPDEGELCARLRESLPAHMVPSGIGVIPCVPLTANGKVDYTTLPVLPRCGGTGEPATDGAASGTEAKLALLAARVLGLETLGTQEDFFAAGGSSLHAARYIARVRNELGLQVELASFLAAPTIQELAAALPGGIAGEVTPP